MPFRLLLSAALIAAPAIAQTSAPTLSPSDAAKAFTLDGMTPAADPAADVPPDTAVSAPASADPAVPAAAEPPSTPVAAEPSASLIAGAPGAFTLDTPIAQLIADPRAKAVLDRDLPGLSDDANLGRFRLLSLRTFQPLTGGQLSDALLGKVGSDLAALPGVDGTAAKARRAAGGR